MNISNTKAILVAKLDGSARVLLPLQNFLLDLTFPRTELLSWKGAGKETRGGNMVWAELFDHLTDHMRIAFAKESKFQLIIVSGYIDIEDGSMVLKHAHIETRHCIENTPKDRTL